MQRRFAPSAKIGALSPPSLLRNDDCSRSSCGGLKRESGFRGACARAGANVDTSATATEEKTGGAGADTEEEEASASGAVNGDEAGQQASRTGKGKQKGDVKATEKRKGKGKGEAVKLMLHNTMSRSKEEFVPLRAGHVGMYVCGVTVYDYSHIGHARVYVSFDVLYRYLQHMGYDVTYVRNFTDVDDKIIKRALDLGEDPLHLSRRFITEFHADMHALGCLPPTHEPKVSEHIPDIIHMIQQIVDSGAGYVVDGGDVFFDVDKAEGYGQLSGRRQEENRAGERVAVDERKRNPADFALWKSAKLGEVSWASPWGEGRPGWHIECSAMSKRYLGFRFDIHGGGRDLIFPHHENELAQSKAAAAAAAAATAAAAGDGAVQAQQHVHEQQQEGCLHCAGEHGSEEGEAACGVSVWLHNGFVNVDSEKMSKSLGNFFTIREVLDRFHAVAVRWFLLSTHYRSPINYSDRQLDRASDRVFYLYQLLADCEAANSQQQQQVSSSAGASKPPAPAKAAVTAAAQVRSAAAAALADDLHTAQAVASLSEPLKLMADLLGAKKYKKDPSRLPSLMVLQESVLSVLALLGLPTTGFSPLLEELKQLALKRAGMSAEQVQGMLEQRDEARKAKDFAQSDAIRDELALVGIMLMDTPAGTAWRPAAISVQDDTDESGGLIFLGAYVSFCFHVAVAKHRARNQELQQALVRAGEAWEWQQQCSYTSHHQCHLQHHAAAPTVALSGPCSWEGGSNNPGLQQLLVSAAAGTAARQHQERQGDHEEREQGGEVVCSGPVAGGEESRCWGAWEQTDSLGDCWWEESAAGCLLDGPLTCRGSGSSSSSSSSCSASSTIQTFHMPSQPLATCPVPATPALSSLLCPSPPQLQYTLS
ncbi:unnamed protein product [Closterium sp. Naga37s-1]|nr:unnamed protein product [Closterium sp. Naga37s-1]